MESLVMLVAFFALATPLTLWALRKRRQQVESWRTFATARGLEFLDGGVGSGPSIHGPRTHDGRTDAVQLFLETRGSSKNQQTYTVVEAGHHLRLPEHLLVTEAGAGTTIASLLGAQDIALGNPAVDPDLRLRGTDEAAVRRALASPRLQAAIHAFVTGHDETSMNRRSLRLVERGWKTDPGDLDAQLDQVQDAVTALLEAVRFDPAQVRPHVPRARRLRRADVWAEAPVAPGPAAALAAPEAPVDRLVADLAAGGTAVAPGAFTIDRRAAREKLRDFQLTTPAAWVLEVVQALIARSATAVHLEADRDDLSIRADGRPFTPAELDGLWAAMLAAGEDDDLRARQRLALGLNALAGQRPKRAEAWSGTPEGGARLVLGPEGEDRVEPGSGPPGLTGTVVTVKLGLADAARNPNADVKALLRERAAHAPVPVTIDGEVVSDGLRPRSLLGLVELVHGGFRAVGGLDLTPGAEARLRLQTDGIWLQEEPIPDGTPGLVVVVENPRFRKDVSQQRLVADGTRARADDLVTAVEEAVLSTLAATLGTGPGVLGGRVEALRQTLRGRLLAWSEPAAFRPGGEARALAQAPLYPTRDGRHVGLADLLALHDAGQPVPYADALTTDPDRAVGTCLDLDRLPDEADRALLVHLLGDTLRHVD